MNASCMITVLLGTSLPRRARASAQPDGVVNSGSRRPIQKTSQELNNQIADFSQSSESSNSVTAEDLAALKIQTIRKYGSDFYIWYQEAIENDREHREYDGNPMTVSDEAIHYEDDQIEYMYGDYNKYCAIVRARIKYFREDFKKKGGAALFNDVVFNIDLHLERIKDKSINTKRYMWQINCSILDEWLKQINTSNAAVQKLCIEAYWTYFDNHFHRVDIKYMKKEFKRKGGKVLLANVEKLIAIKQFENIGLEAAEWSAHYAVIDRFKSYCRRRYDEFFTEIQSPDLEVRGVCIKRYWTYFEKFAFH